MFFNFVDELRAAGIQASFKEHLTLLEALDKDVIEQEVYLGELPLITDNGTTIASAAIKLTTRPDGSAETLLIDADFADVGKGLQDPAHLVERFHVTARRASIASCWPV